MKKYGLIGKKLVHSFSQKFFTEKFSKEKIDANYSLFPLENPEEILQLIENQQLDGLNVTIPYKEDVLEFLDEISAEAKEIGAVNVVKIKREGEKTTLCGFNSDAFGFENSLRPLLNKNHRNALILGTGGASKAVNFVLKKLGISTTFVSRTKNFGTITYADLTREIVQKNLLIVNCTPLGTFPNVDSAPEIPYEFLSENHLAYDLVYNPAETKFLKLAQNFGAKTKNGYEMLELQALESWRIWQEK